MRRISRKALGVATAATLAATLATPSAAEPRQDDRPLVGSRAAHDEGRQRVVTLVTGDRILVTTNAKGRSAATALPREDGTVPFLQTRESGKDLYVYPEGATHALAAGKVDEQLFNVTGLIRQGYDDASARTLPLIALYDTSVARSVPVTPRGAERERVLDVVDGVALSADKKQAADFWADLTNPRSRAAGDLKKLWLDAKVATNLDKSTQQVHAPEAWAAGYDGKGTKVAVLDTGTDSEHPDLKGRVTELKNFTDSDTAEDRDGHGTHTISTVGGSGAASDGKNKGVAPGAELISGKVLNDSGSGLLSWIIAGMEWAAVEAGADVVSMSLGTSEPSDCADPMSQATEELAQKNGTLFVIAAGNIGRAGHNTVSSPGCAPSVLTVGAVDRDSVSADFSSRGPVAGTHTLKPEITAPGVGISAAKAGGRGDAAYQSMSGTSMATPHVAGAAAILKQRHPDWNGQQIKAALVSAADTDVTGDVRETGGGLLDVKGAVDQQVVSSPALGAGSYNWPQHSSDRTTVDVPYTNHSDREIRLDLAVEGVTGNDGSRIPARLASFGKRSVTVPAGATVKVPLTVDPSVPLAAHQYGDVTGRVVATGGGTTVSTPFALYVQPETVTLRVKMIDRNGKPADGVSSVDVVSTDVHKGERRFNEGATDLTYELRAGSYFLTGYLATPDAGEGATATDSLTYFGRPEIDLQRDTTIVLDARKAHRLSVDTDKPVESRGTTLSFNRTWGENWWHGGTAAGGRTIRAYYASVQGGADDGEFEWGSHWRAAAPQIDELKVEGGPVLHPTTASTTSVNLDGTDKAQLADAKSGTPEELAAADVAGKIAMIRIPDGSNSVSTVMRNAQKAGARAILVHHDAPGRWYPSAGFGGGSLPALAVQSAEAKDLLGRLAQGAVTLAWKATAKSPYMYNLSFPDEGSVYSARTHRVRDSRLGKVDSTYHAMGVTGDFLDMVASVRPDGQMYYFGDLTQWVPTPGRRTEYYSTEDEGAWQRTLSSSFPFGEFMNDRIRTYEPGSSRKESWYDGVITPRARLDDSGAQTLAAERQGNLIGFDSSVYGDGEHSGEQGSFGDIGGLTLRKDGEVIGDSPYPFGVFDVPAEEATYELTQFLTKIGAPAQVWKRSPEMQTTWKFRSKLDDAVFSQGLGILFPRYTLPEDGLKTLAAEDGLRIGLSVTGHAGHTPGPIESAKLSYSYDQGATWTEAKISGSGDTRTATVDHAGASGSQVWLKTELTDTHGNSVTQTVARAYDVR
ncbi:S8 family serine peptidase [Streptomyces sp. TRM66268-LWL]|uniref:S8 family serine peptidase n=1 Tax=Streptomyces polyasparticus TaxID=2767826 RepID=A0ABR7SCU2_9ACTN|nr:S8 family serine peptidase [Streptomyces polyasparticus]MBC9712984.1 S8 family serine peptidase [Streptomyces polyasparticus]